MINILDFEVMLSNFEGRDRVSLREFISCAGSGVEEIAYREGAGNSEVPDNNQLEILRQQAAEIEPLKDGYSECIDDLQDWGAYAGDYFILKHDLQGTVDRHKGICSHKMGGVKQ